MWASPLPRSLYSRASFLSQDQVRKGVGGENQKSVWKAVALGGDTHTKWGRGGCPRAPAQVLAVRLCFSGVRAVQREAGF